MEEGSGIERNVVGSGQGLAPGTGDLHRNAFSSYFKDLTCITRTEEGKFNDGFGQQKG